MKKYIVLMAVGIAIMFLAACSNPKEDKARIDRYLDNVYGKMSILWNKIRRISDIILSSSRNIRV